MVNQPQDALPIVKCRELSSFLFHSGLWKWPHLFAELDGNGFFLEFTSCENFLKGAYFQKSNFQRPEWNRKEESSLHFTMGSASWGFLTICFSCIWTCKSISLSNNFSHSQHLEEWMVFMCMSSSVRSQNFFPHWPQGCFPCISPMCFASFFLLSPA